MTKHLPHAQAERFDFTEDRHRGVYTCRRVMDGAAVLYVSHDSDGDWQFLCGGEHGDGRPEDPGHVVCLEHVVARDPSLNALARMHCNHEAERTSPGADWGILDRMEAFVLRCVEDPGWAVLSVGGGDGDPGFSYTVGLFERFGHPELICVGLETALRRDLLNDCGHRVRRGECLPVGEPVAGLLEGYDMRLREVRERDLPLPVFPGYARWFYRRRAGAAEARREFPLLQLLWPDGNGRFPGEAGAAEYLAQEQPLLP